MLKRWVPWMLMISGLGCLEAPRPRGGTQTLDEPPQAADGGTVEALACNALGAFTLSAGSSTVGGPEKRRWNVIVARIQSDLLGSGTNAIWAYNFRVDPARVGETIRIDPPSANASYDTAGETVIVGANCTTGFRSCERTYMAERGFVRFEAVATAPGQRYAGTFSGLALRRVSFDAVTYATRFIEGEPCLGLDGFTFNSTSVGSCDSQTTCGGCTPLNGCGWCTNVGQCIAGTEAGPVNGACGGGDWSWLTTQCPNANTACSVNTTCGTCTPVDGCGWCASTRRCVSGTQTGSSDGMCTGSNWQWVVSQCPAIVDAGVSVRDAGAPSRDAVSATDAAMGLGGPGQSGPIAVESTGAATASSTAGAQTAPYAECEVATSSCVSSSPTCVNGGGQTFGVCGSTCARDAECAAGGVCVRFRDNTGRCLRLCPSRGCGGRLTCRNFSTLAGATSPVCVPNYW